MRTIMVLFTFFAVAGLFGPAAKDAAAQCTHLGGQGACPVGIPNGSTSVTINANGTINWNSGGVSGPCCAAPSGTETGAGLQNLSNSLGGSVFHYPPTTTVTDGGAGGILPISDIVVSGVGFENYEVDTAGCDFSGCSGDDILTDVFGANPNSGYLCDGGGGGCGNDLWVGLPQPGFGNCGPGGCTGPAPVQPLNFGTLIGSGRYSQNVTRGEVDPFGGGSTFQDPITGEAIDLPDNEAEWPDHVKHADKLNTAYVNDEIPYPFDDPDWRDKSVEDFANEPPPGLTNSSQPIIPSGLTNIYIPEGAPGGDTNFTDKPGRFGIGTDTSLGGANGLSIRSQVAKNFGVQGIISLSQGSRGAENPNADLTNYVSTVVTAIDASRRPKNFVSVLPAVTPAPSPAPASTPAEDDTEEPPDPSSEWTTLRFATSLSGSGVARVDTEGQLPVFRVMSFDGRVLDFKSRDDAFLFSDRLDSEGGRKTYDQIVGELPSDRGPINVGPVNTDAVDALTENVPKEFRAPRVNDIRTGEFLIRDPQTGRKIEVKSAAERDAVLSAMRKGATLEEAAEIAQEQAAEIAQNAPVVTPDGLASATTSRSPKSTSSTPAPAGSTVTFTDNRPAIIVRPTRPEGTNVGSMKGVLQGQAYDIEVIRAENGKVYAVGTGENAGHVFGEVKESSNKLFGDFRREGPWTPPPAKTTATATATPGAQAPAPQPTPPSRAANNRVRSQIANSDRDHMIQPDFLDGFESRGPGQWSSAGQQ